MSEWDRGMAIAMLAEAFSVKDLTPAAIRIYSQALEKLPAGVLPLMVQRAIETRKPRWGCLPTVAELREDAEAARIEALAGLVWSSCGDCSEQGWVEVTDNGIKRQTRCRCWHAHQAKVQALNVGTEPLALPPVREWVDA